MESPSGTAFVVDHLQELWLRIVQHLMLTGVSTGLAILMGVPLGILAFRTRWIRAPIVGTAGILQTIPSLAMLTMLLTLLHKIGTLPAIVALTLYALLPIVRNTLTSMEGVSSEVMEAARSIGMTRWQQFRIVRLPLALPVIIAGVRTAAVAAVGIATLSAFIGAGGLGQFINRGLALADTRLILLGAVPAALLALLVDFAIGAANWALDPRRKRHSRSSRTIAVRASIICLPIAVFVVGAAGYVKTRSDITVGSKNFTEQLILGHMMALVIEDQTDLTVDRRFCLGGTMICHRALSNGEIDLYAEYTGTGLTAVLHAETSADPDQVCEFVSREYRRRYGVEWLPVFGFNNTYAIAVRKKDAMQHEWKAISDLGPLATKLRAGFTAEFSERPDGYPGLHKAYRFQFGEVRDIDSGLMYEAIARGEVDIIACFFQTAEADLSAGMHDLNSGYAIWFNRRHRRAGALFQGRFKAILVENESYSCALSRSIHLNPVGAGIVQRPENYRWSSYPHYLRARAAPDWLDWRSVFADIGGDTRRARNAYRRFVEQGLQGKTVSPLQGVVGRVLLGSSAWVDQVRRVLGASETDANSAALPHLAWRPSLEQIELAVAGAFDVTVSDLHAKRIKNNDARVAAVYLIRRLTGVSATQLAKRYGHVSQAAISKTVQRAAQRCATQRRWKQRLARLEKSIRASASK